MKFTVYSRWSQTIFRGKFITSNGSVILSDIQPVPKIQEVIESDVVLYINQQMLDGDVHDLQVDEPMFGILVTCVSASGIEPCTVKLTTSDLEGYMLQRHNIL